MGNRIGARSFIDLHGSSYLRQTVRPWQFHTDSAKEGYAIRSAVDLQTQEMIRTSSASDGSLAGPTSSNPKPHFTQSVSKSCSAVGLFVGSFLKQDVRKARRLSERPSGNGGLSSSTIRKRTG
jgi:hypothetical protein